MNIETGIVTLHRSTNFGAFLQAFALQQTLLELGCNLRFIETKHEPPILRRIKRELVKFRQEGFFRYRHSGLMSQAINANLKVGGKSSDRFKNVFVGSDEIWNVLNPNFRSVPEFFGIGLNADRIYSYAPSMGQSGAVDIAKSVERVDSLKRFKALSGRDDGTVGAVSSLSGRPVEKVLDPTLLLDWAPYIVPYEVSGALVVYTYRFNPTVVANIRTYAKSHGLKILAVGMGHPWADEVIAVSPFEFLGILKSATAVITDTFHGSIMSSLVGANVGIIDLGEKKKLTHLIRDLHLQHRVVNTINDFESVLSHPNEGIGFNEHIVTARNKSINYLRNCLKD